MTELFAIGSKAREIRVFIRLFCLAWLGCNARKLLDMVEDSYFMMQLLKQQILKIPMTGYSYVHDLKRA